MARDPALIPLPDRIETNRLILRGPLPGDGQAICEAVHETFDQLKRWMPWAQTLPTPEDSEINVRKACATFITREDLRFHAFLKEDGSFVASTGLHRIDWRVPRFEIGYWCRASCQHRGLTAELTSGLTRFALDELGARRVEIRCDEANTRSARVAERLGFRLEARMINQTVDVQDQPVNTLLFVATPDMRGALTFTDRDEATRS